MPASCRPWMTEGPGDEHYFYASVLKYGGNRQVLNKKFNFKEEFRPASLVLTKRNACPNGNKTRKSDWLICCARVLLSLWCHKGIVFNHEAKSFSLSLFTKRENFVGTRWETLGVRLKKGEKSEKGILTKVYLNLSFCFKGKVQRYINSLANLKR